MATDAHVPHIPTGLCTQSFSVHVHTLMRYGLDIDTIYHTVCVYIIVTTIATTTAYVLAGVEAATYSLTRTITSSLLTQTTITQTAKLLLLSCVHMAPFL
jgi:hypothetical protein